MQEEEDFDWRGGIVQAVAIILGFSFAFMGRWSLGEGQWEWIHLPALVALAGGAALLIYTIHHLTAPANRDDADESRAVIICTTGMALILAGFVLAIGAAWIRGY
ncbi:MAG TPA: hypothetical protein VJ853_09705 [Thermoanaerobaculia bacterium]|nr:hypothetical protein [Thermoanaerobaculia bacterium]